MENQMTASHAFTNTGILILNLMIPGMLIAASTQIIPITQTAFDILISAEICVIIIIAILHLKKVTNQTWTKKTTYNTPSIPLQKQSDGAYATITPKGDLHVTPSGMKKIKIKKNRYTLTIQENLKTPTAQFGEQHYQNKNGERLKPSGSCGKHAHITISTQQTKSVIH